ncbi:MAG: hypothetical protein R2787_03940 [Saprospiraceae bacterium]
MAVFSQESFTDRGIFMLRGTGSIDVSFQEGSPLAIHIGAGYFLWNDLLVGVDAGYERAGQEDDFFASPFMRYYWRQLFFAEASLHTVMIEDRTTSFIEAGLGYIFYLNDYVMVEPGFYYPFLENSKPSFRVFVSVYL